MFKSGFNDPSGGSSVLEKSISEAWASRRPPPQGVAEPGPSPGGQVDKMLETFKQLHSHVQSSCLSRILGSCWPGKVFKGVNKYSAFIFSCPVPLPQLTWALLYLSPRPKSPRGAASGPWHWDPGPNLLTLILLAHAVGETLLPLCCEHTAPN